MKQILTLLFALITIPVWAQQRSQEKKLYYFITDTSRNIGGVRDAQGKIIIPPTYWLLSQENNEPVTGPDIFLMADTVLAKDSMHFCNVCMIFDRKGNFLYHPFWFDNGPDYYENGLRRFTENNRIGFVNRLGEKVIPANFAFAYPFESGIALVCYDCRYIVYDSLDEHGSGYGGGNHWAIIDRKGNVLQKEDSSHTYNYFWLPKDSLAKALHAVPALTATEQKLVGVLQQLPEVKSLYKQTGTVNGLKTKAVVKTEIYEQPSAKSPYYCIRFSERNDMDFGDYMFLISADGKKIMHLNNSGGILSLTEWRKQRKETEEQ